ncbi:hypothetical protein B5807_02478 [Epicoccum nigrum]|uniref:AA1-like domain-containing protein n=1 Tax=Epicoccum nigrum TaxID=105696 RepID=A0A1Y2M7S9_EPING|nr:hypothetical protein B5807_02478 [Epicoccum nigrum]
MQLTKTHLALAGLCSTALALPGQPTTPNSKKPTGGPAIATVTIYSGPYTCAAANSPPPTDGSAGTATPVSVTENQCIIVTIPFAGAFTATMTQSPKTGTTACYIQLFTQSGCGLTLQNQYHGFPFDGVTYTAPQSTVGCANPPVQSYGALQIVCA